MVGSGRYTANYAINRDGAVLLNIGAIPYRIEARRVFDGPNPTGHAICGASIMATEGITFRFAPGPGV
jgi:hypothetical protein